MESLDESIAMDQRSPIGEGLRREEETHLIFL